jgi:cellulase (glycosyl hydrolase family 5)
MRLLTIITLALLLVPAAAEASSRQESLFQDDNTLIYSGDQRRDQALDELKALGVDVIRTNLLWSQVAAAPNSRHRPPGDRYATGGWARWDALVTGARARGMKVQITLTGPLPLWASYCGGSARIRRTCKPSPGEYGSFVTAAAKRYPSVNRWSIWNEPNQSGWLYPANQAPYRYRALAYEGIKRLRANGHAHDQILLGETAPLGRRTGSRAKRSLAPGAFIRGVFCMDRRGKRLRGRAARRDHCKGGKMKRLRATGWAHHPYTRGGGKNPRGRVGRDDITLPKIGRLSRELNRGAHQRRIRGHMPIYLTEYGFQTSPPDRLAGVRPSTAARWLNESSWIAYNVGRIKSVAQYELYDERDRGAFQTGLRYLSGRAKPGLAAYRLPIWVVRRHHRTTIWGQARAGGTRDRVEVRYQRKRGAHWRHVRTLRPNSRGFIRLRVRRGGYRWRLYWRDAAGHLHARSRVARPASR